MSVILVVLLLIFSLILSHYFLQSFINIDSKFKWVQKWYIYNLIVSFIPAIIIIWLCFSLSCKREYNEEYIREVINISGSQFIFLDFLKKDNYYNYDNRFLNLNLFKGKCYKEGTKFKIRVAKTNYIGIDFYPFVPMDIVELKGE